VNASAALSQTETQEDCLPSSDRHAAPSHSEGLRVVALGGGTGLSTLLHGLREYVANIPNVASVALAGPHAALAPISDLAALVSVTDDGGSSGRLRKHFNMLPPGDLRNCMVALSAEEDLLSRLFNHRFRQGESLKGHNFGNLFVAALTEITGDFAQAIQLTSKILATRGRVYPITTTNTTLVARMEDGSIVRGETNITASQLRIAELMLEPKDVTPLPESLEAIALADLITIGPGSLYTSLITNLLVRGVPQALAAARGIRVYVCNLMSEANESLGLTAAEHIERIYEHAREPIFDYAVVNTPSFSAETLARYAQEGAAPVLPDIDRIEALGVQCVVCNFAREDTYIRHDAVRLTKTLLALGQQPRP